MTKNRMADLINRDAFITYLKTARASAYLNELADCDTEEAKWCINDEMYYSTQSFIDVLKYRPTVDAVPVVHGHWITEKYKYDGVRRCSVCKKAYIVGCVTFNYCPHCGAKMDEDGEQNDK